MATVQKILKKTGMRYRVQFMQHGTRTSKTFKTQKAAQSFLSRIIIEDGFAGSITNQILKELPFSQAVEECLSQDQGSDPSKPQRLRHWAKHFGSIPVGKVTRIQIKKELKSLASKNKPSTLNRYKAAIAGLYTYLSYEYDIDYNPVKGIPHFTENNARTRFLNEVELSQLFVAVKESGWDRLYLLVLMAITTGARRGELLNLTWQDLDLKKRTAHLQTSKNGQQRILTLTPDCIQELMKFRQASGYIFPNPSTPHKYFKNFDYHWKKALQASGINDFKFHDLRHSCASLLAMNGASLLEISDVLGHKSVTMTQRYSHLCTQHKTQLTDRVFSDIDSKKQGFVQ